MKIKQIKEFLILLLIDFMFLFLVLKFIKFIFEKIKDYIFSLQNLSFSFLNLEENLLENVSKLNFNMLGGDLNILNSVIQKIVYYSIFAFIGVFLLYCLFQAISWNLVCNRFRFKSFWKYLLKFVLVNIPLCFVLICILYGVLYNLRGVVFSSWISGTYLEEQFSFGGSFPVLIVLLILFLGVIFLAVNIYILMNRYKFMDAILRSFKNFRDYKLVSRYCFYVLILFLCLFVLRINVVLGFVLFLCLVQIFKMSFSKLVR